MYIGIDIGTSGIKGILLDDKHQILASHTESLTVSRPQALWSEQDPHSWWEAADKVMSALGQKHSLKDVQAIGLTGQMHGAVLLDKNGKILRPAILWNDGRSYQECVELEQAVPESRKITGNLMMPGFTAPKICWVRKYEPEIYSKIDKVLLPKDYLRWLINGVFASDMSDAAGTMWMDVGARSWYKPLLNACGLTEDNMPKLFEGNESTGTIKPELANRWGMPKTVTITAGGGDNAAGAIGVGIWRKGQAMLSLGTSGVYFVASDGFLSNPEKAVHSFCHALPNTWHLMSVMLSAASCLDWAAKITGVKSVPELLALAETTGKDPSSVIFLPYLSGERTPHNNAKATGCFMGLTHKHDRQDIARAVVEGVSFGLAEGMEVLHATGIKPDNISLIGGGARSAFWRQLLADITGYPLDYREGGDVGPALGAARLAMLSCNQNTSFGDLLPQPPVEASYIPHPDISVLYTEKYEQFKAIYKALKPIF
ncbi:xylulokinase [Commensalibacter papalotli (ex Botero et al. 2024)]|uniref:Xylulose kinase n=2 Tax=Commensalibacter papalotli (ex Botero et al. 2024) TaxID=2972766 RepID=A0ABM9HJT0_9PROT|nr:xylulokinase [Commensalibacter papalotli (ex Botero et al. 2024)]CAI3928867.1 Sugar (pentulose or hexulose) kinase (XylB) (PDB:4C23) [Commensalibacter papalotli (ex Botero et al. 2024)]